MSILTSPIPSVQNLSGLFLINKPSGPTSYDMIRWIKRSFRGIRIGHSGTLDPLASGLLIILLGKATKQQDGFMKLEKTYRFSMRLGLQTDSGDMAGKVIQNCEVPSLDLGKVQSVLSKFMGPQTQIPPMYSALKRDGVPLYKLARKGETVDRPPRSIQIYELSLLSWDSGLNLELRVRCSSGTYVRTLAEDLGVALGSCAVMTGLIREKIGSYSVDEALPGDELRIKKTEELIGWVKPLIAS